MAASTIHPMWLGITHLPDWHPLALEQTADVYGFAIDHPDGTIVVDTGVGDDHDFINELYHPRIIGLIDALHAVGIDERDVVAIVNTHLHFDHCGQNRCLPTVPIWVSDAEVEAATEPGYTVPEWASIDAVRRRRAADGLELADGVQLLATPGHTPGHQSVAVTRPDGRLDLIVGQVCYRQADYDRGEPDTGETTAGDTAAMARRATALDSVARLRALPAARLFFSHERPARPQPTIRNESA